MSSTDDVAALERQTRIVHVECASDEEREAIQMGLSLPDVRAFCAIAGTLDCLPSDRAKARVLRFVSDKLDEEKQ